MNLIKRHKGLAFICLLTLILFAIILIIFSRMLFSTGKGEYGDRLKGIVEISDKELGKIKDKITEFSEVEIAKMRIQGKIVYITIIFSSETSKDKAKEIATKSLEYFSEEVKNSYDLEYFLTQNIPVSSGEEDKSYTVAGSKHPDADRITWTRN